MTEDSTKMTCDLSDICDFVDGVLKKKGQCVVIVDGVEWHVRPGGPTVSFPWSDTTITCP